MKINFTNKVIEDILTVYCKNKTGDNLIITDKVNKITKKNNHMYLPFIIEKENKYEGYEKKIFEYFNNPDKYKKKGFNNVEQYFIWYLYKAQKSVGVDKMFGKYIDEYIHDKEKFIALGFISVDEYIEYRIELKKHKNNFDAAKILAIKKEYSINQNGYKSQGVYSLSDSILFNFIIEKAFEIYDKYGLDAYIDIDKFLYFETREFTWKKEFYDKNNSLKGVQKYIYKKHIEETMVPHFVRAIPIDYVISPAYFYDYYGHKNITDYYIYQEILQKVLDRYISLKKQKQINISKAQFIKAEINKVYAKEM